MDYRKLIQTVKECIQKHYADLNHPPGPHCIYGQNLEGKSMGDFADSSNCLWMLDETEDMVTKGLPNREAFHRWVGFIQRFMLAKLDISVEELRNLVRSCKSLDHNEEQHDDRRLRDSSYGHRALKHILWSGGAVALLGEMINSVLAA